jgi:hypothetical protein
VAIAVGHWDAAHVLGLLSVAGTNPLDSLVDALASVARGTNTEATLE